ncbi:MAG: hypothetical protein L6R41_007305 [Letrouitia leprolyta]|nr:MAG: hypothetical protein L6R41_007305 [Letrouitia leprolyta]
MTSTGDPRPDRSSVADEKGNPFVSFSRLVDQQIQSTLRTIFDLPSSFTRSGPASEDSTPKFAEHQKRRHPAVEDDQRLERSLNELFAAPQTREPVEEHCPFLAQQENKTEELFSPRRRQQHGLNFRSQNDPQKRIKDQRNDPSEGNTEADKVIESICNRLCQTYPHEKQENEATQNGIIGNLFLPSFGLALPRSFSMRYPEEGPDSPFGQDSQHRFLEHRTRWREAFEDLLRMSLQEAPPDLWQASSIDRGVAGWKPQKSETTPVDDPEELGIREPENDSNEDVISELDLYKRFLRQQSPRPMPSPSSKDPANRDLDDTKFDKPNVISTLTTTQRQTFLDGRVYTQVILKKRFSDGREESTETEHTTHERPGVDTKSQLPQHPKDVMPTSTSFLGNDGKLKQALGQRLEEKKKNGWFWS